MSRKDYEAIAAIIKKAGLRPLNAKHQNVWLESLTLDLCRYFATTNERFQPNRFYQACGFEEPELAPIIE